ncbi:MAG: hypothetical protein H6642_05565 [Caldilineaceae bacterium]|nr:hypothetical protein [Caldilineaceae bacterium]
MNNNSVLVSRVRIVLLALAIVLGFALVNGQHGGIATNLPQITPATLASGGGSGLGNG